MPKVLNLSSEVSECKPLGNGGGGGGGGGEVLWPRVLWAQRRHVLYVRVVAPGMRQGLTLVHFSAQPKPFLTQEQLLLTP